MLVCREQRKRLTHVKNHPRRNRSPGALLRFLGLVLADDHDGVRFTAKRPKPTDVADHHRPRREPKGSSLLLHSFNPGSVLNDRCSMASCLKLAYQRENSYPHYTLRQ
jgi:hypothetical protein